MDKVLRIILSNLILPALFSILCTFCFSCGGNDTSDKIKTEENPIYGVQWHDSLMHHLPKELDTSLIVKDANYTSLRFYQYIKPVFNSKASLYLEKGQWRLQWFNSLSVDSLEKDDYAIARVYRWDAIRHPNSSTSFQEKFKRIAATLNLADYILVLKSKRKMYVKRKGVTLLTFTIDLGGNPLGTKESDGDKKTPEGVYHLDVKYTRNDKYHKSFMISYPDSNDRARALAKGLKPGNGIMIHGTYPERKNAKDWTNGCIALQNEDMDTLFDYVIDGTKIEIRK
ncbi:L,D-transpeptidase family protein [Pedobacter duraquae]|uniref:L,D-transpeptidase-like protein n=1 Tax=Pedobacter duraquae TaxID=425511 RepID=A0A4R6INS0_9SPHI|nr:L,D-transpeptidase family protein [Pedobacter duraquae]TDO23873.1 L,D-transpeptidase-like protein [Pedobacter duraquae]